MNDQPLTLIDLAMYVIVLLLLGFGLFCLASTIVGLLA